MKISPRGMRPECLDRVPRAHRNGSTASASMPYPDTSHYALGPQSPPRPGTLDSARQARGAAERLDSAGGPIAEGTASLRSGIERDGNPPEIQPLFRRGARGPPCAASRPRRCSPQGRLHSRSHRATTPGPAKRSSNRSKTKVSSSPRSAAFGAMLERTEPDLGHHGNIYRDAEVFAFCSVIRIAARLALENPDNIALCPLSIGIYELKSRPGVVRIRYRALGTASPGDRDALNCWAESPSARRPARASGCPAMQDPVRVDPSHLTSVSGTETLASTPCATDPIRARPRPLRPRDPITNSSKSCSAA